jgi:hypothetical protein
MCSLLHGQLHTELRNLTPGFCKCQRLGWPKRSVIRSLHSAETTTVQLPSPAAAAQTTPCSATAWQHSHQSSLQYPLVTVNCLRPRGTSLQHRCRPGLLRFWAVYGILSLSVTYREGVAFTHQPGISVDSPTCSSWHQPACRTACRGHRSLCCPSPLPPDVGYSL